MDRIWIEGIRGQVEEVRSLFGRSEGDAAQMIWGDGIHVLVDLMVCVSNTLATH